MKRGRPALKPGTHGNVAVTTTKPYTASAWLRNLNGELHRMRRQGGTRSIARANLLQALKTACGPSSDLTLGEAADTWWEEYQTHDHASGTLYRVSRQVKALKATLGGMPLESLTTAWINQHLDSIHDNNGPSAAGRRKTLLTGILDHAHRFGRIPANPARNLHRPQARTKPVTIPKPGTLAVVREHFTRYDKRPRTGGYLTDLADLLLATGVRTGELLALQWGDVNLDDGTLTITATLVRNPDGGSTRQGRTKTDAGARTLHLPQFAVDLLKARQKDAHGPYVFPNRAGGYIDPKAFNTAWRAALADAPADAKAVTPRAYRKTVATHLAKQLDSEAAARQLGHADHGKTANRHYIQRITDTPDVRALLDSLRAGE